MQLASWIARFFLAATIAADFSICQFLRHTYKKKNPEELEHIAAFKKGSPTAFDINFRGLLTCPFAARGIGVQYPKPRPLPI